MRVEKRKARNHLRVRTWILAMSIVGALISAPTHAQLGADCTASLLARTAQVNDDGSFFLSNIPAEPDADDDGLLDGFEVERGLNALAADTDNDTILDGVEVAVGTDPPVPNATTILTGQVLIPSAGRADSEARSFLGACPNSEALVDQVREVTRSPNQPQGGGAKGEDRSDPVDLLVAALRLTVEQAIDGSGPEPSQVDQLLDLRDLLAENPCYSGLLAVDSINRTLLAVLGRWLLDPGSARQRTAAVERVPRLREFELKAELFAPWIDGVAAACREDTGCLVATVLKAGSDFEIDGARLGARQLLDHPEPRLLILRMVRTDQDLHIGLPVLRSLVETTKDPVEEFAESRIQQLLEAREALPPEAGSLLVQRDRYRPIRAMSFVKLLRREGLRLYALLDASVEGYVVQYAKEVELTARAVRPELEAWAPMAVRLLLHKTGPAPLVALVPRAVTLAPEEGEARRVMGLLTISTPAGVTQKMWLVPDLDAGRPRQVLLTPRGQSWAHTVFLFPQDVVGQSRWMEGEYRLAVHLTPFWLEAETGEGRILSDASLDFSSLRIEVAPTPPRVLACLESGGAEQLSGAMREVLHGGWRLAGEPRAQLARWKVPSCEGTEIARLVSLLEIAQACGSELERRGRCALQDDDYGTVTALAQDPEFLWQQEAKELLGEAMK